MHRVDVGTGSTAPAPSLFRRTQLKVAHNPADYETKQVRDAWVHWVLFGPIVAGLFAAAVESRQLPLQFLPPLHLLFLLGNS